MSGRESLLRGARTSDATAARRASSEAWGDRLSSDLQLQEAAGRRPSLVRSWKGENVVIDHPPLDHHLVVLHLGGNKRVIRQGEGPPITADVPMGAVTIIPSGAQYRWVTAGPIDFVHFYVDPVQFNHALATTFDRDHTQVALTEAVGVEDGTLASLIRSMAAEVGKSAPGGFAYIDRMAQAAYAQLAFHHSSLKQVTAPSRHALAPARLRRILLHIEDSLASPPDLAALAGIAGLSRFHFSRAFQRATGESPMAFVNRRRVEAAKRRLAATNLPIQSVAAEMGFASASHFSASFRRVTGQTPRQFRGTV